MALTALQTQLPPLAWQTPVRWASEALQDPDTLLSDHAYLERKAATNVLELFNRWPTPSLGDPGARERHPDLELTTAEEWASTLAGIAKDEAQHLQAVMRLIQRRGGKLQRLHKSGYANDLRTLVRQGHGKEELLDRLLVSALIEARSCERFEILAAHCPDAMLAKFYASLCASEAGHYAVFLKLARHALPRGEVDARWQFMVREEATIIQAQPTGSKIHSGVGTPTPQGPVATGPGF